MSMLASGRKMELQAESGPSGRYRSVVDERTELDSTSRPIRMLPLLEHTTMSAVLDIEQMRVGFAVRFDLAGQPVMAIKRATGEIDFYLLGA